MKSLSGRFRRQTEGQPASTGTVGPAREPRRPYGRQNAEPHFLLTEPGPSDGPLSRKNLGDAEALQTEPATGLVHDGRAAPWQLHTEPGPGIAEPSSSASRNGLERAVASANARSVAADPRPNQAPRRLGGRYRLLEPVHSGRMGSVWLALDESSDAAGERAKVAVKLIPLDYAPAHDPASLASLARVAAHPGLVTLLDHGTEDGWAYQVSAWIEGQTLQSLLLGHAGTWAIASQIPGWTKQLADALDVLHRAGFVHGDVKPDNVLINRNGACLIDLLGVRIGEPWSRRCGLTRAFASPEALRGEPADPRDDVYSLAVLAFRLLTGRLPLPQDVESTGLLSSSGLDEITASQWQVLGRALHPDRLQRPESITRLPEELWPELHTPTRPADSRWRILRTAAATPLMHRFDRRWLAAAVAALVAVTVIGGIAQRADSPVPTQAGELADPGQASVTETALPNRIQALPVTGPTAAETLDSRTDKNILAPRASTAVPTEQLAESRLLLAPASASPTPSANETQAAESIASPVTGQMEPATTPARTVSNRVPADASQVGLAGDELTALQATVSAEPTTTGSHESEITSESGGADQTLADAEAAESSALMLRPPDPNTGAVRDLAYPVGFLAPGQSPDSAPADGKKSKSSAPKATVAAAAAPGPQSVSDGMDSASQPLTASNIESASLPAPAGPPPAPSLSDVPSTPDIPSSAAVPSTPDVPSTAAVPSKPDVPSTAAVPSKPDVPSTAAVPSMPDVPSTAAVPSMPDVPSTPAVPSMPDVPSTPAIPSKPDVPSAPNIPSKPDIPGKPDVPSKPDIPGKPDVPSKPDIPGKPDIPSKPDIPGRPDIPGKPDIPGRPDIITLPNIPARPELPPRPGG